ncbi:hypothetical protein L1D34_30705 [Vibrio mediterranei]|uniref:hypothetical protein n=1 Tax=Vibrio mediterranei TaxID=689 RepID=UPI001EFCC2A2|nr:hypothetical protein [Vibrio mediterranei]MCG9629158.1 hypothetical protein [Vibrio mediterranei]MCY9855136.1 hypothetical protein [Vibrio mediterranei]
MKYSHLGVPTNESFEGEIDLPHLKMVVSDHDASEYKIQYMRFYDDAPYPDIVKEKPHLAFEVDNLHLALLNKEVIIPPNSPSEGLLVAFIIEDGMPIELMEYKSQ